jgi:riboflavin synthase
MFSGLIGFRGIVREIAALPGGGAELRVHCDGAQVQHTGVKDSIAINGVCLTAVQVQGDLITFDVVPETLARTTLGTLRIGERLNVEYSLRLGDRMGGHFVYGHVDAMGEVVERRREGQGERMRIALPKTLERLVCEKAFISVDGVSVTVAAAQHEWFELALIPETLRRTTLGERHRGDFVNLEADPLARYAAAAVRR